MAAITWIMLNPSTADATLDDPTIRRCVGFTESWGASARGESTAVVSHCGRYRYLLTRGPMRVVNLFAYRATNPNLLAKVNEPIGPDNDQHLLAAAKAAELVVCAWGVRGELFGRGEQVLAMLRKEGIAPHYLRLSTGGSPTHPLYLPGELVPVRWPSLPYHFSRPIPPVVVDISQPFPDFAGIAREAVEDAARCYGPMAPVWSMGGNLIGYRCRTCNTTADAKGRTEHGPRPQDKTNAGSTGREDNDR